MDQPEEGLCGQDEPVQPLQHPYDKMEYKDYYQTCKGHFWNEDELGKAERAFHVHQVHQAAGCVSAE